MFQYPDDLLAKQAVTDWKDFNRKEGTGHLPYHQAHVGHYNNYLIKFAINWEY